MSRETEKRQLRAGNFTMNNGRVLSTINLLRENTMPSGVWRRRSATKALKSRNL